MRQRLSPVRTAASAPLQAAAHAGAAVAADSPRQRAQGERIAQLQSGEPVQLNGRKTSGFNRGKSHSTTTPSGKVKSHQPGKGREENKRKSAAKNRRRDRTLKSQVANSQSKAAAKKTHK